MKTKKRNFSSIIFPLFSIIAFNFLTSCGGGTTGTSSTGEVTGEFRVQGLAQQESGQPLAKREMLVFSSSTKELLLGSETDSSGKFDMSLPGSTEGIILKIDGERSDSFNRSFTDSSILTSVIRRKAEADLNRAVKINDNLDNNFFDVQFSFELQINSNTLCPALTTSDNKIFIVEPIDAKECLIEINVSSKGLENESFYAQLIGTCQGESQIIGTSRASTEGIIRIDVANAYQQECELIRVSAYSNMESDTQVIFPIGK